MLNRRQLVALVCLTLIAMSLFAPGAGQTVAGVLAFVSSFMVVIVAVRTAVPDDAALPRLQPYRLSFSLRAPPRP